MASFWPHCRCMQLAMSMSKHPSQVALSGKWEAELDSDLSVTTYLPSALCCSLFLLSSVSKQQVEPLSPAQPFCYVSERLPQKPCLRNIPAWGLGGR